MLEWVNGDRDPGSHLVSSTQSPRCGVVPLPSGDRSEDPRVRVVQHFLISRERQRGIARPAALPSNGPWVEGHHVGRVVKMPM